MKYNKQIKRLYHKPYDQINRHRKKFDNIQYSFRIKNSYQTTKRKANFLNLTAFYKFELIYSNAIPIKIPIHFHDT